MKNSIYNIYEFPECQGIIVSGDIHGDFNLLVNKVCAQYQMRNTLIIVAGDCGFGFEKKGYYENIVKKNAKRMNDANNWILFIRGNHDNPAYFDGSAFKHKRFKAIPDYSVVKACEHTLLCIGGAISIDRENRKYAWRQSQMKHFNTQRIYKENPFEPNYYWPKEYPVFNKSLLDKISSEHSIDTVITHSAPSFCELQSKSGLIRWAENDENLITDVNQEREVFDKIYQELKGKHPLSYWCYGHFHQSWSSNIDGVKFKMLDITELYEIPIRKI